MNPTVYLFHWITVLALLFGSPGAGSAGPADGYGIALETRLIPGIGPCMATEVSGNRLYAAGAGTFHVLDISKPDVPIPLGTLSGLGNTRQIIVRGSTAFVTARQDGLWLITISDPRSPRHVST